MTDIRRKRGDTYAEELEITSSTTGLVLDITGYSFVLTVDPEQFPSTSDNNLMSVTGSITDAVNGLVEFAPTALDADQTPGSYYYDIQMTDAAGRVRTIQEGRFIIIQDISK